MKRILFLAALCLSLQAHAQKDKREEGVKIGVKGGLNISNFMSDDIEDNAIRTSIHLGVATEFIVSDKWSFQPELYYSGQGFSNQDPDGFSREKFNYINLPLIAKYYATKNLSVEVGPQVGLLLSAKNKTNDTNDDIEDQKAIDFGLVGGLGYELSNGIFFQARYNLGLTNINDGPSATSVKYTNSVILLSVGAFF